MCTAKIFVMFLTLFLAFTAVGAGQQALLERLRTDHQALVAVERDFEQLREQGALGAAEAADYADYLARLRERVSEDCLLLARADIPLPADVPCPAAASGGAAPVIIDQRGERTSAERAAIMDAELSTSLGEFDEMLLREQERVKADAPRSEAGGGAGGAGGAGGGQGEAGGAEGGQTAESGESGEPPTAGADQPSSGTEGGLPPSGAAGGRGTQTTAGGRPADIPDGSDDDLVARQMREAAEKETDPELKKKLWEEYRKYKQGTR